MRQDPWLKLKAHLGALNAVQVVDQNLDKEVPVKISEAGRVLGEEEKVIESEEDLVDRSPKGLEVDWTNLTVEEKTAVQLYCTTIEKFSANMMTWAIQRL